MSDMSTDPRGRTWPRRLRPCSSDDRRTEPHDAAEKCKQECSDSDSEESETGSDGKWSGDGDPLSDQTRS